MGGEVAEAGLAVANGMRLAFYALGKGVGARKSGGSATAKARARIRRVWMHSTRRVCGGRRRRRATGAGCGWKWARGSLSGISLRTIGLGGTDSGDFDDAALLEEETLGEIFAGEDGGKDGAAGG